MSDFNEVEMESRIKQLYVKDMMEKPDILKVMDELAEARAKLRELEERVSKLEGK